MKDVLSDQQNEVILNALDDAIKNGPWDRSNFLRAIGKNLSTIRENFANQLGSQTQAQIDTEANLANRMAARSEQKEIFVSLYSADGTNLQSWEKIISNLPRQMTSRPIYDSEEQVQNVIKSKENKQNEAYVAIYINHTDIIPVHPDKALSDKLGNALLTLKDKTLNVDNISRFIHLSGVYQYDRGRLIKN